MKNNLLVAVVLTFLAYVAYPAIIVAVAAGVSGCSLESASGSGARTVDAGDDAERRYDGTDSYYSGRGRYERSVAAHEPQTTFWTDLKDWLSGAPWHLIGLSLAIVGLVGYIASLKAELADTTKRADRFAVLVDIKDERICELESQVDRLDDERRNQMNRTLDRLVYTQDHVQSQLGQVRLDVVRLDCRSNHLEKKMFG